VAGIEGFIANLNAFYDAADQEGAAYRDFTAAWWERFGNQVVGVADLYPLAENLACFDLGSGSEHSRKSRFGRLVAKLRDRVIGDYQVVDSGNRTGGSSHWQLVSVISTQS
jgi:hypothetical protein